MDKEIFNMEEAAELFGVSIKTFIKLLKEEKVPGRKIGREWRFSRKALIDWLSSGDSQQYSLSESDAKEFFNQVADVWEDLRTNYYDESVKNNLLSRNLLSNNMTVLDIGAGDGYISRTVASFVKKVIAVDISEQMLKELMIKAKSEGISNIEAIEADGREINVPSNSVDLVCANMYLHHIEDPKVAIAEMARVLKPGGGVFVADLYEHTNKKMMEEMHDVWSGFSEKEMKSMFRKVHFKNIQINILDTIKNNNDVKIFVLTAVKPE